MNSSLIILKAISLVCSHLGSSAASWITRNFLLKAVSLTGKTINHVCIRIKFSQSPSFYYVIVLHIIAWVYGWVVQEQYTSQVTPPSLDWSSKGYAKGMFVILLWRKYSVFGHLFPPT